MTLDATTVRNGCSNMAGLDGRTRRGRLLKTAYASIASEIGRVLTMSEHRLAQRCALLTVATEEMEHALARGEEVDAARYATVTNELRELLVDLRGRRSPA